MTSEEIFLLGFGVEVVAFTPEQAGRPALVIVGEEYRDHMKKLGYTIFSDPQLDGQCLSFIGKTHAKT